MNQDWKDYYSERRAETNQSYPSNSLGESMGFLNGNFPLDHGMNVTVEPPTFHMDISACSTPSSSASHSSIPTNHQYSSPSYNRAITSFQHCAPAFYDYPDYTEASQSYPSFNYPAYSHGQYSPSASSCYTVSSSASSPEFVSCQNPQPNANSKINMYLSSNPGSFQQSHLPNSPSRTSHDPIPRSSGQTFTCDYPSCKKSYPRPCDLNKHKKRHQKPFPCEASSDCDSYFSTSKDRDRHIKSKHRREEHLICPVCGHTTARKDNMKDHVKRRHGEESVNEVMVAVMDVANMSSTY